MNQKEKLLNELLTDDQFRSWVINGDHEEHWIKWQENHPGHLQILEDAKAIVKGLPVLTNEVTSSEIEQSFQALLHMSKSPVPEKRISIMRWLSYAAAVIALLISLWIWKPLNIQEEPIYMVVSTTPGEQENFILPDSTVVVLNGNSSLKYHENHQTRNIELKGEAHFDVQKKEGKHGHIPFNVTTEDIAVRVLGTTFSVGVDSIWTTVVLEEGKVELFSKHGIQPAEKSLIMKPNEKVVFNSNENTFSVEQIDATEFNSWTQNELSLVNRSAEEVARWIKRNYNIRIVLPEEYKRSSLTGSVNLESPETAIKVFAIALGLEPLKTGDKTWDFKTTEN